MQEQDKQQSQQECYGPQDQHEYTNQRNQQSQQEYTDQQNLPSQCRQPAQPQNQQDVSMIINLTWNTEEGGAARVKVSEYQIATIAQRKEAIYDTENHEFLVEIPRLALDRSRFQVAIPEELPLNEWGGFMIPGHQMLALSRALDRMQQLDVACEYLMMTGRIESEWQDLTIHLLDPRNIEAEMLLWAQFKDSRDMPEYDSPERERFISEMHLERLGRVVEQKEVDGVHAGFDLYRLRRTYASDMLYRIASNEHRRRLDHPTAYAASYLASCIVLQPKFAQLMPLFERMRDTRVQLMQDHLRVQIGQPGEERLYWCRYTEADLTAISSALLEDLKMSQTDFTDAVTLISTSEDGHCPCRMEALPIRTEQTLKYGLPYLFGPVPGPMSQAELLQNSQHWPPR